MVDCSCTFWTFTSQQMLYSMYPNNLLYYASNIAVFYGQLTCTSFCLIVLQPIYCSKSGEIEPHSATVQSQHYFTPIKTLCSGIHALLLEKVIFASNHTLPWWLNTWDSPSISELMPPLGWAVKRLQEHKYNCPNLSWPGWIRTFTHTHTALAVASTVAHCDRDCVSCCRACALTYTLHISLPPTWSQLRSRLLSPVLSFPT